MTPSGHFFYFASYSHNWREVRKWQQIAIGSGHYITMDWTSMVESFGRGDPDINPKGDLAKAAFDDVRGVETCTTFVNIWHPDELGALIETGIAIREAVPVWIAAEKVEDIRYCIFWELPNVELMTHDQLLARITAPRVVV
jgi:hypothetical protein